MALCLGDLRMAPASFWAMSPCEIGAILRVRLRQSGGGAQFGRGDLDRLRALYPDRPQTSDDGVSR